MLVLMFGNISTEIDLSADLLNFCASVTVSSEWFIVVCEVYDIPVRVWVVMSLVMPR